MADSRWIALPAAAQALGLTYWRAWNMILTGRLEGQKRGKRWFVNPLSLSRLTRSREGR